MALGLQLFIGEVPTPHHEDNQCALEVRKAYPRKWAKEADCKCQLRISQVSFVPGKVESLTDYENSKLSTSSLRSMREKSK